MWKFFETISMNEFHHCESTKAFQSFEMYWNKSLNRRIDKNNKICDKNNTPWKLYYCIINAYRKSPNSIIEYNQWFGFWYNYSKIWYNITNISF